MVSKLERIESVRNTGCLQVLICLYSSGPYDEPFCSSESLHAGVLAVGYDTLFISRKKQNQYGVATQAWDPIVE
ncbi:uncharacterized protein LOC111270394 [Varroa jacobsoni]|uniref:uncharacterized protein LOC111270394 n=1 Tax=Varroa jacobsoni TaxID=62625 RepID=UPI000BF39C6C|nr:uncharacterized protein LOC111270394 [Varroa jacobsoni]